MSDVSRETRQRLEKLQQLVVEEAPRQNLVSSATISDFYKRHILDSLQLLPLLNPGPLLDIGSGAGFPGLALACCIDTHVHLVEPRAKRAQFLQQSASVLGIADRVTIYQAKVERVNIAPVATITARAVANLSTLFSIAQHLCDETTRWVLPKGRTARSELEDAERTWQGVFHVERSMTDSEAAIIVADRVRRRKSR